MILPYSEPSYLTLAVIGDVAFWFVIAAKVLILTLAMIRDVARVLFIFSHRGVVARERARSGVFNIRIEPVVDTG